MRFMKIIAMIILLYEVQVAKVTFCVLLPNWEALSIHCNYSNISLVSFVDF